MENIEMTSGQELNPFDDAEEIKKHIYGRFHTFKVKKQPVCKEWTVYPNFYKWAIETGYQIGEKLHRYDASEPYSPDNCYWEKMESADRRVLQRQERETINRWNKTVNVFRKACGLKLFPVKDETEGADDDA